MRKAQYALVAGLLTAGTLFGPAAAEAQQPVPPVQEETVEVTDELLERFVAVYPAVVNVAQAAQNELATVETPEEAQQIQADAQTQIAELLQEGEVTPREYEAVVQQVNEDPAMMAKLEGMLAEERDGGSGGF